MQNVFFYTVEIVKDSFTYPVVDLESAPMTTPPSNSQAMIEVCNNKAQQTL